MFGPWVVKIPWRRKWQPTPVFLPGNSMDRGTWQATVHGVAKSQTKQHAQIHDGHTALIYCKALLGFCVVCFNVSYNPEKSILILMNKYVHASYSHAKLSVPALQTLYQKLHR